jgi:hypothetical protein
VTLVLAHSSHYAGYGLAIAGIVALAGYELLRRRGGGGRP